MFARRTIYSFQRTTKVSRYKYLHCRRKTKVSYYITFFQTLLKTFSCGLCSVLIEAGLNHLILLREKESKLCLQEEQYIPFNEQQKCHVTNIYTVDEKQKYHITLFCEKNKSIILHHVLPNYPENVFRAAFVMLKLQQQCRNCQTKYRTVFQVKEENRRFIWLSKECFITRKQNVSKW